MVDLLIYDNWSFFTSYSSRDTTTNGKAVEICICWKEWFQLREHLSPVLVFLSQNYVLQIDVSYGISVYDHKVASCCHDARYDLWNLVSFTNYACIFEPFPRERVRSGAIIDKNIWGNAPTKSRRPVVSAKGRKIKVLDPSRMGVWGVVSLPSWLGLRTIVNSLSWVRGRAPVGNIFWHILKSTEHSFLHLYAIIQCFIFGGKSEVWGQLTPCSNVRLLLGRSNLTAYYW